VLFRSMKLSAAISSFVSILRQVACRQELFVCFVCLPRAIHFEYATVVAPVYCTLLLFCRGSYVDLTFPLNFTLCSVCLCVCARLRACVCCIGVSIRSFILFQLIVFSWGG
jgi:hypothetical protein